MRTSAEGNVKMMYPMISGLEELNQANALVEQCKAELRAEKIPFIALDSDPARVRDAAAAGEQVVFGDAARREVLVAAGVMAATAPQAAELSIKVTLPEIAANGPRPPNRPYVAIWLRNRYQKRW